MANPNPYQMQPMPPAPQLATASSPPRRVKQGVSKAVPVAVSAGLAIGVFCGLLFGVGVEKEEAEAASTPLAESEKKPTAPPPSPSKVATTPPAPTKTEPATPPKVATTPPETPEVAKPVKVIGKLAITIKPEAIASIAKVTIDGVELKGATYELDLSAEKPADPKKPEVKKTVKVVVKASGYKDLAKNVEIVAAPNADVANSVELELIKVARPPSTPGTGTPPPQKPKCKKPPCGLIDI
jgi:hypothetical protein